MSLDSDAGMICDLRAISDYCLERAKEYPNDIERRRLWYQAADRIGMTIHIINAASQGKPVYPVA